MGSDPEAERFGLMPLGWHGTSRSRRVEHQMLTAQHARLIKRTATDAFNLRHSQLGQGDLQSRQQGLTLEQF